MNGKGAQALFLFFGVLVCAWASGRADAAVWHWALALALLAVALFPASQYVPTWAGAAVAAYVLWAMFHTWFLTQSYSPGGLYQPLFLATGFAIGRRAFDQGHEHAWGYAWGWAVVAIATYALLEAGYTGALAAAPFETPAVLAALINLALLPALAYALWGPRVSLERFVAITVLVAGLVAASSRGGWIGLMVGLAAALIVLRGRIPAARNAAIVATAVFSAAGLVAIVRLGGALLAGHGALNGGRNWAGLPALFLAPSALAVDSSLARLELYALAFNRMWRDFPFGSGYLSFAQFLEAGRGQVPSFGSKLVTFFVHNDYLQALLELGVPGLCAMIAVMLPPLVLLLRNRALFAEPDLVFCSGLAGGVAAMAFQSGVDFPFYIPVCLASLGFLLGALAARSAALGIGILRWPSRVGSFGGLAESGRRVGVATGFAILLVPLAAEWSLVYAQGRWRQGLGQEAAYGFEFARRLQPRDWRYAWYAGKFWTAQAAAQKSPEAATLADRAFAAGVETNQLDVRNLQARIELQRRLPHLLKHPASPGELDAWSVRAMELAPRNAGVRIERIFVLERAGKIAAARREAVQFAFDEPDNPAARFLSMRLEGQPN